MPVYGYRILSDFMACRPRFNRVDSMSRLYTHSPKVFGNRLRTIREKKGLTQFELAEKCGLTASWVSHFENGNRSPGIENLIRLSFGLCVNLDRLCGTDLWLKVKPAPSNSKNNDNFLPYKCSHGKSWGELCGKCNDDISGQDILALDGEI